MGKNILLLIMNLIARRVAKTGKEIPRWQLKVFNYCMSSLLRRK